jgi:hypothetical protein
VGRAWSGEPEPGYEEALPAFDPLRPRSSPRAGRGPG